MEYVEFTENPTKSRQSRLPLKLEGFCSKLLATGDEGSPVVTLNEFL